MTQDFGKAIGRFSLFFFILMYVSQINYIDYQLQQLAVKDFLQVLVGECTIS